MRRGIGVGSALILTLVGCLPAYLSNKHMAQEGSPAPPITGLDSQGQTRRLSDYQGKVVLLSFWHGH